MNTVQNYVGGDSPATNPEPAAQNPSQPSFSTDGRLTLPVTLFEVNNRESEAQMLYWLLEDAKQVCLRAIESDPEDEDEVAENFETFRRYQDTQSNLVLAGFEQAAKLFDKYAGIESYDTKAVRSVNKSLMNEIKLLEKQNALLQKLVEAKHLTKTEVEASGEEVSNG